MSDQQRALYVLTRLSNRRYEEHPDDRVVPIIEELAAVRAEERARIVADLRQPTRALLGAYEVGAGAERGRVADEIEHEETGGEA